MQSYKMEVSKKENGAYVKVGEVEVYYPLLSELGIAIDPSGKDEEGFPTYADEKVQYAFDSILAAVKVQARNKLQTGTATLKDGASIADTVEALIATAERNGEALKNRHATFAAMTAFLASTGKSAAFVAGVMNTVKNTEGIPYQSAQRRGKIVEIVAEFAGSLSAEDAARFERTLSSIVSKAQTEVEAEF